MRIYRLGHPGLVVLLVCVGCSFQASCGGKKLNMDKAKEFVTTALEREVGQKPETTCPESVKIEKGAKFSCTAKFGAATATVEILQNDDEGNVTISSITGIVVANKLEKEIADGIGKQANVHVDVACGDRVRPATAGLTFQCDVKDAKGTTGKVNVNVTDATGAAHWEIAK
jgi:hypothetical protein